MTASSVRNGLSSDYASFFKEKKKAKPKKVGLSYASPKMQRSLVEYRRVKAIWWAARMEIDGGRCQFVDGDGNRCHKQASRSPHHVYFRGKYLCDPSTYMALCLPGHHSWPHDNPKEAEERGYIVRDWRGSGIPKATI